MSATTFYVIILALGLAMFLCLWILLETDPDLLRKDIEQKYSKGELDADA